MSKGKIGREDDKGKDRRVKAREQPTFGRMTAVSTVVEVGSWGGRERLVRCGDLARVLPSFFWPSRIFPRQSTGDPNNQEKEKKVANACVQSKTQISPGVFL